MLIGIFSGTFNPIHEGHTGFARLAAKRLELDKVILMVEKSPRRKKDVAEFAHRLVMAKLAVEGQAGLVVADWPDLSATFSVSETTKTIKRRLGAEHDYVFLLGADLVEHMNDEQWPDYRDLLAEFALAVALRTEDDGEALAWKKRELRGADITALVSPQPQLSASRIREEIASGKQPSGLDDAVYQYIKRRGLYAEK